jgi:DNA mismatch repair protein MLH1
MVFLAKGGHPFVYMSLEIEPNNLDVNVHPTKQEVNFLHEDRIVEKIKEALEEKLLGSNDSRKLYTQSLLPGATNPTAKDQDLDTSKDKVYDKNMVRTDFKEQKIQKYFQTTQGSPVASKSFSSTSQILSTSQNKSYSNIFQVKKFSEQKKEVKLTSILQLRREFEEDCDQNMKELLGKLIYVGGINTT